MPDDEQIVDHAEDSPARESSATPLNVVTIPCYCFDEPHESDTVTLATEVSVPLGFAALTVSRTATEANAATGELMSVYLRFGVIAWTLTDEKGQPEKVTHENILRRLTFDKGGYEVGDRADDLYSPVVMRPLLAARAKSSQNGQPEPSTSQKNGTGSKRRTASGPSSPTSTAGQPSEAPVR